MAKGKVDGSFDTNMLLRLLLGDVPSQTQSVEHLLERGGLFDVPDAALIEMVYVLEKVLHKDRALIGENILSIVRHKQFRTDKKLFTLCMPIYVAHPLLSIVDCILLTHARLQKKTPLYTFDKDLAKHGNGDAKIPA